jgi:hypothetical protein
MVRPAGLEPATTRLEGGCSIQLSYGRVLELSSTGCKNGRSGGIRTPDILLPKQTRYRAALHSETIRCSLKLGYILHFKRPASYPWASCSSTRKCKKNHLAERFGVLHFNLCDRIVLLVS